MTYDPIELKKRKRHLQLMINAVVRRDLDREADLLTSAWFDYRFMTPHERTVLFRKTYVDQYRIYHAKFFSKDAAENVSAIHMWREINGLIKDTKDRREYVGIFHARHKVDQIGLPYDYFIAQAFEFANIKGFKRLPRPNQLFFSERDTDFLPAILDKWEERQSSGRPMTPMHRAYRESVGGPAPYRDGLDGLLRSVRDRDVALARMLVLDPIVSRPEAVDAIGEAAVGRAERAAREHGIETKLSTGNSHLPGCMGLQPADTGPVCVRCDRRADCARLAAWIAERPDTRSRDAIDREAARDRKRKQRSGPGSTSEIETPLYA